MNENIKATYAINEELNGIEIKFDEKPDADTIAALKAERFRWHRVKKIWYAKNTEERLALAKKLADGQKIEASKAVAKKSVKNKLGIEVGDIFVASWGYDQTNVDFFQVIELAGKQSCRIRQVYPERIAEEPTCSMAADRTYKITKELQPYPDRSPVAVHDQEHGDLHRIQGDDHDHAYIKVTSDGVIEASYCPAGKRTEYESWYA